MPERFSLTELQQIIRDSLYLSFPDSLWVIAEILEIKENSTGHCYLELVEKDPGEKNIRARIKGIIWNTRYRFLKAFFENATGEHLRDGIKVLVKTKIEYHELYGLSLIISDIDPAFTLGEMAMKRQLIIRKLEEDGVFQMNKGLQFPLVPQRIAVISSKNAAGYSDFLNHLINNTSGYLFFTTLFESTLQGPETESSIIKALNKIAVESHKFDIAVIIRGGGSQSDLSWFDNYNIAYHITQFPLPVVTGIGHDKDISVTDLVAYKSLKTPTAVADLLIETVTNAENRIIWLCSGIIKASRLIIEKNRNKLDASGIRLIPLARIMVSHLKDKLSSRIFDLINNGKALIIRAGLIPASQKSRLIARTGYVLPERQLMLKRINSRLKSGANNLTDSKKMALNKLDSNLQLLDPVKILKRGYSITRVNGKIIRSVEKIRKFDIINTQLTDGILRSSVIENQKASKPETGKPKVKDLTSDKNTDLKLWET